MIIRWRNQFLIKLIISKANLIFKIPKTKIQSKMKVKMIQAKLIILKSKIANKNQGITILIINILRIIKLVKFNMDKTSKDTKILNHKTKLKILKSIKNLILILKLMHKHRVKAVLVKIKVLMTNQINHLVKIHL